MVKDLEGDEEDGEEEEEEERGLRRPFFRSVSNTRSAEEKSPNEKELLGIKAEVSEVDWETEVEEASNG